MVVSPCAEGVTFQSPGARRSEVAKRTPGIEHHAIPGTPIGVTQIDAPMGGALCNTFGAKKPELFGDKGHVGHVFSFEDARQMIDLFADDIT